MPDAFDPLRGTRGSSSPSILSSQAVRKLGDGMLNTFHQVGEGPVGHSHAELLHFLGKRPWLLHQYPLVLQGLVDKYPWLFTQRTLKDHGYTHTLH